MPLVTVLNLRPEDRVADVEVALRDALVSIPALEINAHEVDLAPVRAPDGFRGTARINVDLWERQQRTKSALQELATAVGHAFKGVVGRDRKVTVVIRPYDVGGAGWVSL
jgi:hypothetical protein